MASTSLDELSKELENIINEFLSNSIEARNKALMKGAEFMKGKIEEAAPVATGEYKNSFIIVDNYTDHKYIGNTKVVKDKSSAEVPLSNVLEYSSKPHIRATFDHNLDEAFNIIKKELEGGIK